MYRKKTIRILVDFSSEASGTTFSMCWKKRNVKKETYTQQNILQDKEKSRVSY